MAVGWLLAFLPLPILASSAMAQPAGRLLAVPAACAVWLRASPLLCAVDALALLARFATYCIVLRIAPRQALTMAAASRFAADDGQAPDTEGATAATTTDIEHGTTTRPSTLPSTVIRLAFFVLGLVLLAALAVVPGGNEARWTVAWGWLFAASFTLLEAATHVCRWDMAKPQYTLVSDELDRLTSEMVSDSASDSYANTRDSDPAARPRLAAVDSTLKTVDSAALYLGLALHGALAYWAFLDLVQPHVNRTILAVNTREDNDWHLATEWHVAVDVLSVPLVTVVAEAAAFLAAGIGFLVGFVFFLLATFASMHLPASVRGYRGGIVGSIVKTSMTLLGAVVGFVCFILSVPSLEQAALSDHMMWIYRMLSVEFVVLVLFFAACFVLFFIIASSAAAARKRVARKADTSHTAIADATPAAAIAFAITHPLGFVRDSLARLSEDAAALASLAVATALLAVLWYRFRFAESAHWLQDWRDALVANVTTDAVRVRPI